MKFRACEQIKQMKTNVSYKQQTNSVTQPVAPRCSPILAINLQTSLGVIIIEVSEFSRMI